MKIRLKISAIISALIVFCSAFLTACAAPQPLYTAAAPKDVISSVPEDIDGNNDVLCDEPVDETNDKPFDPTVNDGALPDASVGFPDNSNDNAERPPENDLPQDGATQPPQNDAVATQTVTVTYLATEGGNIIGEKIQQVPVGGYTEQVIAQVNIYLKRYWWKFVKWSDGVTTPERSDKAEKSFTVTAIFEKDGETDGDLRFRLLSDGSGYEVIAENEDLTEAVIPAYYKDLPVKEVFEHAFSDCDSLEYLYIPDTVVKIGSHAFYGTRCLKKAEGMVNVKEIGDMAFTHCKALENVTGLQKLESIGSAVFVGCNNLEYIVFPETLKSARRFLQGTNGNDKTIMFIRKTATEMAKMQYDWCVNNSGVRKCYYIGTEGKPSDEYTFKEKDELYDFFLNYDKTGYRIRLKDKGVTEALIPSSYNGLPVTEIYDNGFSNSNVVTVYIPRSIKKIGSRAFYKCKNLVRVIGMEEVEEIYPSAFAYCEKLNGIILPDTLEKIGTYLFRNNTHTVYTRKPVEQLYALNQNWDQERAADAETVYIGDGMPDERFELIYYKIDKATPTYRSPVAVAALNKNITYAEISNRYFEFLVVAIRPRGFAECKNLEKVTMYTKNYYISVDEEAFMDCVNLKTFVGSNYISKIGAHAFKNCPNLKLILEPNVVIYN